MPCSASRGGTLPACLPGSISAKTVTAILTGEEKGPKRNAVLLNAGAALYGAGKAESMKMGVKLAAELIDSGKAYEALLKAVEVSNAK